MTTRNIVLGLWLLALIACVWLVVIGGWPLLLQAFSILVGGWMIATRAAWLVAWFARLFGPKPFNLLYFMAFMLPYYFGVAFIARHSGTFGPVLDIILRTFMQGAVFYLLGKDDDRDKRQLKAISDKIKELVRRVAEVHGPQPMPEPA